LVSVSVALVKGVITSMYYTLSTGYAEGAYNYGEWIFRRGSETPYDAIVKRCGTYSTQDKERSV
jgi:hypothetical protein